MNRTKAAQDTGELRVFRLLRDASKRMDLLQAAEANEVLLRARQ
jgi:hypothetical protein